MIKIEFKSEEEKERLLKEHEDKGYSQVEVQYLIEGNFLVFSFPTNEAVKLTQLEQLFADLTELLIESEVI